MEYYQQIQNRAGQTVAVINEQVPALTVGTFTATDLSTQSQALDPLAQTRDNAVITYDQANGIEHFGYLALRGMVLSLPKAMEGELSDEVPAEASLLDLLDPVYAIQPRTTEAAIERGRKLVSALTAANTYLAALVPPRGPVTSGGKAVADLAVALAAQPGLEQTVENKAADMKQQRTALRSSAREVDRLSKRFYKKMQGEARTNPALATAMDQIDTGPSGPETLGIYKVLQGGTDQLHILVSYENGTFTSGATNTIEWMVVGVDQDFSHSAPVDPSGNTLGPFAVAQTVKVRTRVKTDEATTTGAVRSLKLLPPVT